jgi:hypothetical protein
MPSAGPPRVSPRCIHPRQEPGPRRLSFSNVTPTIHPVSERGSTRLSADRFDTSSVVEDARAVFMTTEGPKRPIRVRISPTEAAEDLTQSMTVGQRVKSGGRGPDSGAPREEGHRARPGDSRVNALRTADIDQMYGKFVTQAQRPAPPPRCREY